MNCLGGSWKCLLTVKICEKDLPFRGSELKKSVQRTFLVTGQVVGWVCAGPDEEGALHEERRKKDEEHRILEQEESISLKNQESGNKNQKSQISSLKSEVRSPKSEHSEQEPPPSALRPPTSDLRPPISSSPVPYMEMKNLNYYRILPSSCYQANPRASPPQSLRP